MYSEHLDEVELDQLTKKTFAPDTMKNIGWVINMYDDWHRERNEFYGDGYILCDLKCMINVDENNLCLAMWKFITEVCKLDGKLFPGKTVYDIVVCVQMYLEIFGYTWKLIDNEKFVR